ncbi:hypothetical protein B4135_3807 [Caldibacillus debilis]|uniref:Uncharacterized protein n=1 Tax=Caldibacillus debilis TaxID=301148 RepID=A0A150LAW4_9BACI|nr:hypothetical protein B4135_3807 [Caldibacillus debilis]
MSTINFIFFERRRAVPSAGDPFPFRIMINKKAAASKTAAFLLIQRQK